ncbi:hypothetical protein [Paenibacillus sp. B2(2019)]|uniref:hypothetical protein n=1 Tax=Paenibacillus sp. B2(2019) TaxID=2607754 RepID=UPI0021CE0781|nr:hypothetical protein [Paenibacillus sp. B2(2019)]
MQSRRCQAPVLACLWLDAKPLKQPFVLYGQGLLMHALNRAGRLFLLFGRTYNNTGFADVFPFLSSFFLASIFNR